MKTRKFDKKQLAWLISFVFFGYLIQLALALNWPTIVVWVLVPFVAFFTIMTILPVFRSARLQDKAFQSGASIRGTRFTRDLGPNTKIATVVENWALRFGYRKHSISTGTTTVYMRAPMGMMPIFVAFQFGTETTKLESWIVAPSGVEEGLTSGFSIRMPNWIGVSEVSKLLAELGQPPVDKLKK